MKTDNEKNQRYSCDIEGEMVHLKNLIIGLKSNTGRADRRRAGRAAWLESVTLN